VEVASASRGECVSGGVGHRCWSARRQRPRQGQALGLSSELPRMRSYHRRPAQVDATYTSTSMAPARFWILSEALKPSPRTDATNGVNSESNRVLDCGRNAHFRWYFTARRTFGGIFRFSHSFGAMKPIFPSLYHKRQRKDHAAKAAVRMAIAATMHSSASEMFNTNQTSQERTKLCWPSLQDHRCME